RLADGGRRAGRPEESRWPSAPRSGAESARNGDESEERECRDRQHVPDQQRAILGGRAGDEHRQPCPCPRCRSKRRSTEAARGRDGPAKRGGEAAEDQQGHGGGGGGAAETPR